MLNINTRCKTLQTGKYFIRYANYKSSSYGKLLGVEIDEKLKLNLHISNIYKFKASQLSAKTRLKNYPSFDARKLLIKSDFMSNFNYFPFVLIFYSPKSLEKLKNLEK